MDKPHPEDLLARLIRGTDDPGPIRRRTDSEAEPCQHWTGPVLLERAAYLRKMARAGEGWASDTIKNYPGHSAMLVVRLRTSSAEMLEGIAQVFIVLEGRATLLTGGTMEKPRKSARGETTGAGILGGSTRELRPGDVVHIAAGVPVQFLVAGEKPFSCIALRITEIEEV